MLELMSDARRAEIKARYEVATPGPWIYHTEDVVISAGGDEFAPQGSYIAVQGADATDGDMFFIAHARTDIPDLYAENTALRAVVSAMESDKVNYDMNLEHLTAELERVTQAKQDGRMIELPAFPQDMDDILEPLKVQSALNSEVMKLNFRKEHKPKDVSILDYTIIAALYKALTDAEIAQRKEQNDG